MPDDPEALLAACAHDVRAFVSRPATDLGGCSRAIPPAATLDVSGSRCGPLPITYSGDARMLTLSVTVPAAGVADPRYMVVVRDHDSPEQPLVLEYRLASDGTPSLVGHIASCLQAAERALRLEVPQLANRGAADAPAPGGAPARRRLGVYAPEFLRDVAAEYVELVAAGVRSPVTGLARRRGVHFSTAVGWLSHARAAGYLGPQPRTPRRARGARQSGGTSAC